MLTITIEGEEHFNNETQEFINLPGVTVNLEHSLVSLSKWESKHQIPFLSSDDKTEEQILDYIRFMILDGPPEVVDGLSSENLKTIQAYIESPQSATTFGPLPGKKTGRPEIITAEVIYHWMVIHNVPFECEAWHLNRLFALLRICNIKQGGGKKMSKAEIARQNRELNAQRKAQLGTRG